MESNRENFRAALPSCWKTLGIDSAWDSTSARLVMLTGAVAVSNETRKDAGKIID